MEDVPESLRERLDAAGMPADAEAMAARAVALLKEAMATPGRNGAWPLLAADALLTEACAAAAEAGQLEAFFARYGPAGIAARMAEVQTEGGGE